jgi:hypothetical protein
VVEWQPIVYIVPVFQTNLHTFILTQFQDDADSVSGNSLEALTAKDLTKYAYGVAKGMEYIVSKGVSDMKR